MVRGERARRDGRQPAAGLRDVGARGRVLWLALVLYRRPRGSVRGARPDLAAHVTVPDVLIQPHSAPLGIAFYAAAQFPPDYRGDAFVTLHGSWNRAKRTGYKVVRLRFAEGKPTGEYEDFLTGFVVSDQAVWGRPVGVAVAHDGALLVSEDGNGTIWRVSYHGEIDEHRPTAAGSGTGPDMRLPLPYLRPI